MRSTPSIVRAFIRTGHVKTRKQIAAEETQRVIVEASARLFLEHGYHSTSIGRIAAEAGAAAAAAERAPVPVPQFMREQAEGELDPRRIIAQLIAFWRVA